MGSRYRFGAFYLHADEFRLWRDDVEVAIGPRPFDLLVYLVRSEGRIVTQRELRERVWGVAKLGRTTIPKAMSNLRQALGGSTDGVQFIETIPRRGYRFAHPIECEAGPGEDGTNDFRIPGLEQLEVPGFVGRPAIAVLPFSNLSSDKTQPYLADGISDELITRLAMWRVLPVIARESSFHYRASAVNLPRIGRDLGVRYVVHGTMRRDGETIRMNVKLGKTDSAQWLWGRRFVVKTSDLFTFEEDLTRLVVGQISAELLSAESRHGSLSRPRHFAAWELAQQGWWHYYRHTREDNVRAQELLQRSLEIEPHLALSHVGMAAALAESTEWTLEPARALVASLAASEQAVACDPSFASGHALAATVLAVLGQHARALSAAEIAVQIDPSLAIGQRALGMSRIASGNPAAAIAPLQLAMRLSPRDAGLAYMLFWLGAAHFHLEDYARAIRHFRSSLLKRPDYSFTYAYLAASYGQLGERSAGLETLADLRSALPQVSLPELRTQLEDLTGLMVAAHRDRIMNGLRRAGWFPEA